MTVTKYYHFSGQRIAMSKQTGDSEPELSHLHSDHLGSTVLVTDSSGDPVDDPQQYFAYGSSRGGSLTSTDHNFTGQKLDGSGLIYYNARYYDPEIGQFISPDTMVPNPANVSDYNRFMYTRGNPLKYNDPTGHWVNWAVGAGIGGVIGGSAYIYNEIKNGDGFSFKNDWKDLGISATGGAVAGALMATPGMQSYGVGIAANLVGDHASNIFSGNDFSAKSHTIAGITAPMEVAVAGLIDVRLGINVVKNATVVKQVAKAANSALWGAVGASANMYSTGEGNLSDIGRSAGTDAISELMGSQWLKGIPASDIVQTGAGAVQGYVSLASKTVVSSVDGWVEYFQTQE